MSEKDVPPVLISKIELICFRHIRLINMSSKYNYVQRGVISWNLFQVQAKDFRNGPLLCLYVTKPSCTGVYHPGDKIGKKNK